MNDEITQPIIIPPKIEEIDRIQILESRVIALEDQIKYLVKLIDKKNNNINYSHSFNLND